MFRRTSIQAGTQKTSSQTGAFPQESFCLIAGDGLLRIQAMDAELRSADLHALLTSVTCAGLDGWSRIEIDFSCVRGIGAQWSLVWAMIMDFARKVRGNCRLIGLQGEPAAMASMYRCNRELMSLLAA